MHAGNAIDIVEKPTQFLSNWAITGLYFYDNAVLDIAAGLRPSTRGELEITDVNRRYMELKNLHIVKLGRGYAWLDTGTHDAMLEAAEFVRSIQHRQGLLVGCPEEVAYLRKFITTSELRELATRCEKTGYGRYLRRLAEETRPSRSLNQIGYATGADDRRYIRICADQTEICACSRYATHCSLPFSQGERRTNPIRPNVSPLLFRDTTLPPLQKLAEFRYAAARGPKYVAECHP